MQPTVPLAAAHKSLLVVGPDPEVEGALAAMLEPVGWQIRRAGANQDALLLAQSTSFDLIVTARHTSGRDDVEFLRKLRRVRPHIRFIILADESTPEDVIDSMRQNAFGYLSKGFSFEALKETVQKALESPSWDDGIEVFSATPQWICLAVRCDLATADRLLQFLREITDIPEEERHDVGVAFREMLLNAMEHGGHFDPEQYVEITYVRTKHMVMCRIKDPGEGFTLDEIKHAAVGNPPDDPIRHVLTRNEKGMRPGGYGMMLAKHLVDDLLYTEKGNEVLLVKYLHQTPEHPD